jgi:hypothetical protein
MNATDTHATIEELLEAVLSVRPVPRLYNGGQLSLKYKRLKLDGGQAYDRSSD